MGRNRLEGSDCRETLADIIVLQAHDANVYMRQPAVQLQVVTVDISGIYRNYPMVGEIKNSKMYMENFVQIANFSCRFQVREIAKIKVVAKDIIQTPAVQASCPSVHSISWH